MIQFSFAVFLSAFLLFQVQPIIARFILPWFGGTPAVWTACMLFFQVGLLLGYLYAHILASRVPPRQQPVIHLVLLTLSFLLLPIAPPESWVPTIDGQQTLQILGLLAVTVGIPFALISASAPLLQHWFAGVHPGKSPFRLYALSNLGSLIALLSYPVLVEPQFAVVSQANIWSVLYIALAAIFAWCGIKFRGSSADQEESVKEEAESVSIGDRVLWVSLAACGSIMLLAVTNQVSQDIAVVPFLWILPLSLYLITFIIAFDKDAWYQRPIWITLLAITFIPLLRLMFLEFQDPWISIVAQIGIFSLALFACCMVCHGELARRRSAVPHLTTFYLYVALGGALGGVFVNLIAPLIFPGFWELHVGLLGTVALAGICIGLDRKIWVNKRSKPAFAYAWSGVVGVLAILLVMQIRTSTEDSIYFGRGFFGVLFVYEWDVGDRDHERGFYHGKIQHGRQMMYPSRQRRASSYYGVDSGVGTVLLHHPRRRAANPAERNLNIGLVGLGVGTLATYGADGDTMRFYEIDPQVETVAREYFTYLENSNADVEVVLGDARVSMQRELSESGPNNYDVLVLDAFSGDSVPVHLLTEEAFNLYAKHLNDGGILAVHITNQYLDLSDVVRTAADRLGMYAVWVEDYAERQYEDGNDWVLIGNNQEFLRSRQLRNKSTRWDSDEPHDVHWTDDFSNLFQVIVWD